VAEQPSCSKSRRAISELVPEPCSVLPKFSKPLVNRHCTPTQSHLLWPKGKAHNSEQDSSLHERLSRDISLMSNLPLASSEECMLEGLPPLVRLCKIRPPLSTINVQVACQVPCPSACYLCGGTCEPPTLCFQSSCLWSYNL
jgi:hypothetical protein